MKVLWILYIISCPNCEWEVVNTYKTESCGWDCTHDKWEVVTSYDTSQECIRHKKSYERIRQAIGYLNDPARFECVDIHELVQ